MSRIALKYCSNLCRNHKEIGLLLRYLYSIILISEIITISNSKIRNLAPAPYIILQVYSPSNKDLNTLGITFKSDKKPLCPTKIYLNNIDTDYRTKQTPIDCTKISIDKTIRNTLRTYTVKLEFGQDFADLTLMFEDLNNLLEADLSNCN